MNERVQTPHVIRIAPWKLVLASRTRRLLSLIEASLEREEVDVPESRTSTDRLRYQWPEKGGYVNTAHCSECYVLSATYSLQKVSHCFVFGSS